MFFSRITRFFFIYNLLFFSFLNNSCAHQIFFGQGELYQSIEQPVEVKLPVEIYVGEDLPKEWLNATKDAIKMWNDAVGFTLFRIYDMQGGDGKAGLFLPLFFEKFDGEPYVIGKTAFYISHKCISVTMSKGHDDLPYELKVNAVAHELGHVLFGIDHEESEESVMYPVIKSPNQRIMEHHIYLLRKKYNK